jgi:hypothetical protein
VISADDWQIGEPGISESAAREEFANTSEGARAGQYHFPPTRQSFKTTDVLFFLSSSCGIWAKEIGVRCHVEEYSIYRAGAFQAQERCSNVPMAVGRNEWRLMSQHQSPERIIAPMVIIRSGTKIGPPLETTLRITP